MTFDLEFEKLLIMLKGQYHSLFDKRKLKIESQGNQDGQYFDQDSESDSDYEDQEPNQRFNNQASNQRFNNQASNPRLNNQSSNPRLNNQLSAPRISNQAPNSKFGYIANRSPNKMKEEPIMEVRGK